MDVIPVPTAEHNSVLQGRERGERDVTPFAHPPWKKALVHKRQIPSFITFHLVKLSVLDRDTFMKNEEPRVVLHPAPSTAQNALSRM